MVLDLQLANRMVERGNAPHPSQLFPRRQYHAIMRDPARLDAIAKRARASTWRRMEGHNKQVQHFLDRDRFQQNATWRAEFERLSAIPPPQLQPHVAERMEALKEVIVNQAPRKVLY